MTELIFATHNPNKVKEVRSILGSAWHLISLAEAGLHEDIPEPYNTLEANARIKAQTIYQKTGKNSFSEDTGLEVTALDGAPGVLSARYAGPQKSAIDNINLLLRNLGDTTLRKARFRTVISLFLSGKEYQFEGTCNGQIIENPRGSGGFGYDPIFVPEVAEKTFAEMGLQEKNRYSHRAKAFQKLSTFLSRNANEIDQNMPPWPG